MAGLTDALSFRVGLDVTEVKSGLATVTKEAKKTGTAMDTALDSKGAAALAAVPANATSASRALKTTTSAAQGAAGASRALSSGLRGMAQQMPDVISSLAAGANPMTVFMQQGLQVVQTTHGLGAAVAAAAPLLAGLTAAVAAGAAAWALYTEDQRDAEAVSERVMALQEAQAPLVRALRDATLDLAVATGALTEQQGEMQRASQRAYDQFNAATGEAQAELRELRQEQDSVATQIIDFGERVLPKTSVAGILFGKVMSSVTDSSADLEVQSQALNAEMGKAIEITGQLADTEKQVIAETDKRAASTRGLTEALREKQRADSKGRAAILAAGNAEQELIDIRATAAAQLAGGTAAAEFAVQQRLEATIATIDELVARGADRVAAQEAVAVAVAASEAEIDSIRAQAASKDEARRAASRAQQQRDADAEIARQQRIAQATATARQQLVGGFGQFLMTMSEQTASHNAEQSLRMFRIAQGLLIAQTTMQAVAAGVRAFADYPWPASAAVAAAAGAQALAGVASIASQSPPQFGDTPGAIRAGNAGLTAGFAPGDYVIAAQSPAEVQRQAGELARDSGKSAADAPAPVVIVTERYKHFGAYWRDQRKTPGQIRTDARRGEASGQRRY